MKKISILKIARDLLNDKKRTSIVILAMILGVFSVAVMVTNRDLLNQNLKDNFRRTNPASFTVVLDSIPNDLRAELVEMSAIEDIEIRQSIFSRFRKDDVGYTALSLFMVEDFDNQRINKFSLESGNFPSQNNEIVIERTGGLMFDLQLDETYELTVPKLGKFPVKLSGIVHDPGQAPSQMERTLYGYVRMDFASDAFIKSLKQEVKFTVADNKYSLDHIVRVSSDVIEKIEKKGYKVYSSNVPPPGEHVHAAQMDSFMFLIVMFGILILLLSCFLIVNMMSAIMTKEIRQIGIMKAIGASTSKITFIYLSIVLILGAIATTIGASAGIWVGIKYAQFNVGMLNFTLIEQQIGVASLSLIIFMGILLPAIIVYLPIRRASKISIQKALNDYGVSEAYKRKSSSKVLLEKLGASKAFIFSWRNAFRRKGRLALTLVPLIIGGAVFISAFNIQLSSDQTVAKAYDKGKTEFYAVFDADYPVNDISKIMEETKGVTSYELRNTSIATIPAEENDMPSQLVELRLVTVNSGSDRTNLEMLEGSWLSNQSTTNSPKEIVINQIVADRFPKLTYGSQVDLMINGTTESFSIVGVKQDYFAGPQIYMSNEQYVQQADKDGLANILTVDLGQPTPDEISDYIMGLELAFEEASIGVRALIKTSAARVGIVQHLILIFYICVILSTMILIVGGLGIMSTMSMNIIERKREIGILRAIGVTRRNLFKSLTYEGLTVGIISWVFSAILSIPISYYLGNKFYDMFFGSNILFTVSWVGLLAWFFVNVSVSIVSMLLPAKRTTNQAVNELIAYE